MLRQIPRLFISVVLEQIKPHVRQRFNSSLTCRRRNRCSDSQNNISFAAYGEIKLLSRDLYDHFVVVLLLCSFHINNVVFEGNFQMFPVLEKKIKTGLLSVEAAHVNLQHL